MRIAVAAMLVAALAGTAAANGRPSYISTVHWKTGDPQKIIAGATFGLLRSEDGGQTWHWYCEKTVGYGGTYDPDYVYAPSGAVFATTFDGARVMRDDCTFTATALGDTFVTNIERSSTGAVYITASATTDTKIYRSTDDGMTFPTAVQPPGTMAGDWWQSLEVAPSDAMRVYLAGYRLLKKCTTNSANPGASCTDSTMCVETAPDAGVCEPQKEFLLYKSVDAGASFTAMNMTGIDTFSTNSAIEIAAIDPTDPDIVFARVTFETGTGGESIYRSIDGGVSWTKILSKDSSLGGISFVVRADHSCVAGTRDVGSWKSTTCDSMGSFTALTNAPHIGCLYESPAHEIWACTQNSDNPMIGITGDGYGIMKSTDLATWTGVLKFQDIAAPQPCAAGTVQEDRCVQRYMGEQSAWCCLVPQLGITSTTVSCEGYMACFGVMPDVTVPKPPGDGGCCDVGPDSKPPVILSLLVAASLLFHRRRPKEP